MKNGTSTSVGFGAALVGVVLSASCGSASNGFPGGGDPATGGGNGDASCGFGGCTDPNQDGGFVGDDASATPPPHVNGLVTQNDCPGNVSAANATALAKASSNGAGVKILYPYDSTVYPGGIAGPVFQWSQTGTPSAVYVHLQSTNFDYQYCATVTAPNVSVPLKWWNTAFSQSNGKSDPMTISLATLSGGTASGMVTQKLIFAKGSLAGDVYYNTYASHLVATLTPNSTNGAVIRIQKGVAAPILYTPGGAPFGPCVSCHSLSADGTTLAAQQHTYPGSNPLSGKGSMAFNLKRTPKPDPLAPEANSTTDDWGFSAVYPDGSYLLTSGESAPTITTPLFPGAADNNPGMSGPKTSTLYDTRTSAVVPVTGLTTQYAMMPMFSPDGKHVVFNDFDTGMGHTLTMMDFDVATKTFSNAKSLYTGSSTQYAGWPFFTADNKWVIFAVGDGSNYATEKAPPLPAPVNSSQLYIVSTSGGTATRLDQASGYSNGQVYLPGGAADTNIDFYPTVNPIPTGGYFWVYFTSRRAYGNLYNKGSGDLGSKSIWVSAIDASGAAGKDPSHPAFYLPGQELGTGNIRAFAVLAPCSADGASCEGGYDCCGGSCTAGRCAVPQAACAGESDRCTNDVPCCNKADSCLGGYCGIIVQ